jgi:cytochrome P450
VIRWQTPLAHMRRHAVQDADVMGTIIPAGDKIILWYISGNHDKSVFENADALVIDRPNARRHLSFGYGVHRCVGARLTELQVEVLAEEMAKRRIRVHVQGEPERVAQSFVSGYVAMPVEVERY